MKIQLSDEFKSKYKKTKKKDIRLISAIDRTLRVFEKNPKDLSLHNKELRSPYDGLRGIKVDHKINDYRAIYEEIKEKNQEYARFRIFGTHVELFNLGKKEKKKATPKK